MNYPEVLLIAGLPGAGKTTLATKLQNETGHQLLSRDALMQELTRSDISSRIDQVRAAFVRAIDFYEQTISFAQEAGEDSHSSSLSAQREIDRLLGLNDECFAQEIQANNKAVVHPLINYQMHAATTDLVNSGQRVTLDNPSFHIRDFRLFSRNVVEAGGHTTGLILVQATAERLITIASMREKNGEILGAGQSAKKIEESIRSGRDPVLKDEKWQKVYQYRVGGNLTPIAPDDIDDRGIGFVCV